jgi:hypothetical protein
LTINYFRSNYAAEYAKIIEDPLAGVEENFGMNTRRHISP